MVIVELHINIVSTNHIMKEETKYQMWGSMIPSMSEAHTLPS